MKKIVIKFNPNEVKVRKRWLINPVTRVVPNGKIYDRKKIKKELREIKKEYGVC